MFIIRFGKLPWAKLFEEVIEHASSNLAEQQVDADCERDRGARPVEFLFERYDQHGRGGAHAGDHNRRHKGDGDDDPCVMQPVVLSHRLCLGWRDFAYKNFPVALSGIRDDPGLQLQVL